MLDTTLKLFKTDRPERLRSTDKPPSLLAHRTKLYGPIHVAAKFRKNVRPNV